MTISYRRVWREVAGGGGGGGWRCGDGGAARWQRGPGRRGGQLARRGFSDSRAAAPCTVVNMASAASRLLLFEEGAGETPRGLSRPAPSAPRTAPSPALPGGQGFSGEPPLIPRFLVVLIPPRTADGSIPGSKRARGPGEGLPQGRACEGTVGGGGIRPSAHSPQRRARPREPIVEPHSSYILVEDHGPPQGTGGCGRRDA